MPSWKERGRAFLFAFETDTWLAFLRVGLGLQLAAYVLSLAGSWNYFLAGAGAGLVSREVSEALVSTESRLIPRIGWLVRAGGSIGLDEETVLLAAWITLLLAAILLIVGFLSRLAAIAGWFLHLCAAKSGGLLSYGVDNFMTIGLFYLMWSPLPDRYALDAMWRKGRLKDPRMLGFFRRLLQLHLCVIYFFGGLTKCLGSGWWDGSNLWRALTRPPFDVLAPELIVNFAAFLPVIGISIWVIEMTYPIFIWLRRTRWLWLALICAMHVGIGLTMGMHLFALIMIVLNLAAFGPPFRTRQPEKAAAPLTAVA